jgi:hypothetical protein
LYPKAKDARGNNNLSCFRLGEYPFEPGALSDDLFLRPDTAVHGTIEPSREMPLNGFQSALAATRDLWVIDEN